MTQDELLTLAEEWIEGLMLTNWSITFSFDEETEDELEGQAECRLWRKHLKARIIFASDAWPAWSKDHAERILVHELIHCVLHPLQEEILAVADTSLGKQAFELFKKSNDRTLEQITDQLETVLTAKEDA